MTEGMHTSARDHGTCSPKEGDHVTCYEAVGVHSSTGSLGKRGRGSRNLGLWQELSVNVSGAFAKYLVIILCKMFID